jgi:hypothetical protein
VVLQGEVAAGAAGTSGCTTPCRRRGLGPALPLAAAVAGLSYATFEVITIQGGECNMETVHAYSSFESTQLKSLCPNKIKIVAIDPGCKEDPRSGLSAPAVSPCTVGLILENEQACFLPQCAD